MPLPQGFHCSSVVYFDPKKLDKKVEENIGGKWAPTPSCPLCRVLIHAWPGGLMSCCSAPWPVHF